MCSCVSHSWPVPQHWSAKCFVCTSGSVLFNMSFSYTLFTLSNIEGSVFFFLFFFMHPAQQGWVQRSRWLERWNLKAVHLKSSICICNFFHYYFFFFTFNLSPFLYPIYSVYLLTLVESHEVVLLKNQDKCNKQETGVLNVYFYLPSINSPT